MYDIFKFWNLLLLAIEKMSLHLQSNVIWKRIKLETSAWSSFVGFLKLFKKLIDFNHKILMVFNLQGDQAQMGKSKSLVFLDANIEWFEIFFLWKNINWRFLYQNFRGLGQRFCLPHNFEPTASFHSKCKFLLLSYDTYSLTCSHF